MADSGTPSDSRRTSSDEVRGSVVIDAPPATVFEILADPRQHSRIDGSGMLTESMSGPERLSKGARFGMRMRWGAPYRITNRVIEFDEGRRIAWKHFGPHVWRYELTELPDGRTEVTESWDISRVLGPAKKIYDLMGWPSRAQHGIDGTLPRLKEAAEADAR